jgi:hypothetical protein
MFKWLALALAALGLLLTFGLFFWLWPGVIVRIDPGAPATVGSRTTIVKLLRTAGLKTNLLRLPLVIIKLDTGEINPREFTIWQRLNPQNSDPPGLACRWDKTRVGGRIWTLEIKIDPPRYRRLPGVRRTPTLNQGIGYCLGRMVNENLTDPGLINATKTRIDDFLPRQKIPMFQFQPAANL